MSEKEIIEGNKLIAEFVDYEFDPNDDSESVTYNTDYIINISDKEDWEASEDDFTSWLLPKEMKFHSSWDWLMPAINKAIDIIGFKTINECTDFEWRLFTCICDMKISTPIDIAFYNLIEFIKWYNENNC